MISLKEFKDKFLALDPKASNAVNVTLHLIEETFGFEVTEKLDFIFAEHQSKIVCEMFQKGNK